jgi:hypothetical protein
VGIDSARSSQTFYEPPVAATTEACIKKSFAASSNGSLISTGSPGRIPAVALKFHSKLHAILLSYCRAKCLCDLHLLEFWKQFLNSSKRCHFFLLFVFVFIHALLELSEFDAAAAIHVPTFEQSCSLRVKNSYVKSLATLNKFFTRDFPFPVLIKESENPLQTGVVFLNFFLDHVAKFDLNDVDGHHHYQFCLRQEAISVLVPQAKKHQNLSKCQRLFSRISSSKLQQTSILLKLSPNLHIDS